MGGAPLFGRTLPALPRLIPEEVKQRHGQGAALVDARSPSQYDGAHIRGSYNIGIEDAFSAWVGWVLPPERPLILVDQVTAEDARRQLFRIGYDNVVGVLDGGVQAWREAGEDVASFETGEIDDLVRWLQSGEPLTVLDVRNEDEWIHGHVPGAVHLTVPEVEAHAVGLPRDAAVAVHCASGYRAGIAASILEQAGIKRLIRIEGGFPEWEARHLPAVIPG